MVSSQHLCHEEALTIRGHNDPEQIPLKTDSTLVGWYHRNKKVVWIVVGVVLVLYIVGMFLPDEEKQGSAGALRSEVIAEDREWETSLKPTHENCTEIAAQVTDLRNAGYSASEVTNYVVQAFPYQLVKECIERGY